MASLDLAAYYANKAALQAKGFGGVEDLNNDPGPVGGNAALNDANAAAILGLPAAAPPPIEIAPQVIKGPQPLGDGMSDTPTMPWEAPEQKLPGGGFIVEPPPEAAAIVAAANPNAPPVAPASVPAMGPPAAIAAPPMKPAPAPAHVGGGPGGGGSFAAPHAATMADKENAVLLPGQKASFDNDVEAAKNQSMWSGTIADKHLEIEAKAAEMHAAALEQQSIAMAKEKADREEFESYYAGEQNKLAAESDKIATAKMDPNRLFKGDQGWLAVTAAIAASIFGVLGAPATGGKNSGVEAVNNAINRDLALQEKDLDNQKQGVARKSTLLAQKYAVFGDKQRAMAAARIDAWKLAIAKADSYAERSGSEVHALENAKFRDAADRAIAKEQENFGIGVEAGWKTIQAQKAAAAAAAAAAQAAQTAKYNDMIMKLEGTGAEQVLKEYPGAKVVIENNHIVVTDPTTGKRLWEGAGGGGAGGKAPTVTVPGEMNAAGQWSSAGTAVAHSPEAATKYMAMTGAAKSGLSIVERMRALRNKNGGGEWLPSSEDKAEADMLARQLFKADKTVGENSDKDAERIQATLPDLFQKDFKAWVTGGKAFPDALLNQWADRFQSDIATGNNTFLKKPPANPLPLTAAPAGAK